MLLNNTPYYRSIYYIIYGEYIAKIIVYIQLELGAMCLHDAFEILFLCGGGLLEIYSITGWQEKEVKVRGRN